MEKQLFDWKDWDTLDTFIFVFYECTLKQKIGNFEIGQIIDNISMDYEEGKMRFFNNDGNVLATFELKLQTIPVI